MVSLPTSLLPGCLCPALEQSCLSFTHPGDPCFGTLPQGHHLRPQPMSRGLCGVEDVEQSPWSWTVEGAGEGPSKLASEFSSLRSFQLQLRAWEVEPALPIALGLWPSVLVSTAMRGWGSSLRALLAHALRGLPMGRPRGGGGVLIKTQGPG